MFRLKMFFLHYGESLILPNILLLSLVTGKLFVFILGVIALLALYIGSFFIGFKGPMKFDTPDGYNQPYHPSVVYFKDGWNGWKYWMAFTPFPVDGKPYPDRWENPCVVVSQDGVHWQYPDRMKFLDELTEEQINNKNYYSDTHLIYNSDEDCLQLFYRLNAGLNNDDISIFRIKSYNGIDWSGKERIESVERELYSPEPVSQAVVYHNEKYKMWYVANKKESIKKEIRFMESYDGRIWNNNALIKLYGKVVNPWHIDCQYIDGKYYLLIYSFDTTLTLWKSDNGVDFDFIKQILKPSIRAGVFYNVRLYRSCLIKNEKEWRVYFSAHSGKSHQIGLMTGKEVINFKVKSGSGLTGQDVKLFFHQMFAKLFSVEIAIIGRVFNLKAIPNRKSWR